MAFGIDCDDGWFQLVWEVSEKLAALNVVAKQVKQKLGLLVIYIDRYDAETREILAEAKERSSKTCEKCGKDGILREELSWLKTLCDTCLVNRWG